MTNARRKLVFWMKEDQFREVPSRSCAADVAGMSGTNTMVAEISAHMAQAGYDVYVICHENVVQDGVTFITDADGIPGDDAIIYCPTFFLFLPAQIATFKRLRARMTAVVVWLQCILKQGMYNLCALPDQVYIVAPSRFALTDLPQRKFADISIIPNGLNPIVFSAVPLCSPKERLGVWTFHACWERGGNVAYRAFCRYPHARSFLVADLTSNSNPTLLDDRRVAVKPRMSKRLLARQMAAADYFVYPLVLPNAHVHHDTYGCAVLEAMACGAIVVSWNVACLGELYGDHAILLDPPEYNGAGSASSGFASCSAMLTDASVDRIVEAITECDADPVAKEARREAAREWALRQTWERSGRMFERVLQK